MVVARVCSWVDSNRQRFLMGLAVTAVLLLTFGVYISTLWYGYVFDDYPTIIEYIHARKLDFLGLFFRNTRWVSRIMNQVTYVYWKDAPFAYRSINLLMHVGMGFMVYTITRRLLSASKTYTFARKHTFVIALLACMLFLLHPVQTQTVTYITQMRLEGLVMFFTLATAWSFIAALQAQTARNYGLLLALAYVMAALASGTKEIVGVLPLLMVTLDWFFIAEGDWRKLASRWHLHLGFFVVVWGLLALYGIGPLKPKSLVALANAQIHNNRGNVLTAAVDVPITRAEYAISQFKVVLHYLMVFLWPVGLSFDYDVRLSHHWTDTDVMWPATLLLLLGVALVWLYQRVSMRPIVFGFVWFFIAVLPRASIFPSTELICDYKTFLASFGFLLGMAYGLVLLATYVYARWPMLVAFGQRKSALTACSALCIMLAAATVQRNQVWSSEYAFWDDAIKKSGKSRGYNNRAVALWEMGRLDEAIKDFKTSIEKDSFYAEPHVNLGTMYQVRGEDDKAFEHFQRAIEIGEGHPELFNNLGMLYETHGKHDLAEVCFKQALDLQGYNIKGLFNLAQLYESQGKREQACDYFKRMTLAHDHEREGWYHYGRLALDLGRKQEGCDALSHIDPGFKDSATLLGCAYFDLRQYVKAAASFKYLVDRDPNNTQIQYNLGQALMQSKQYAQAARVFQVCLADQQNFPYAPLHRIKCLYLAGDKITALDTLNKKLAETAKTPLHADVKALKQELLQA